jgi:hypothetical protein
MEVPTPNTLQYETREIRGLNNIRGRVSRNNNPG